MVLSEAIVSSIDVLMKQKIRTLLTMAGFAFGIALMLIILSVGRCAGEILNLYYSGVTEGKHFIVSFMSEEADGIPRPDYISLDEISEFNLNSLTDEVYGIAVESPETKSITVPVYDGECIDAELNGVSSAVKYIKQLKILSGRFITEQDCTEKSTALVIPDTLALKLYGSIENSLFSSLELRAEGGRNEEYTVVGVYMSVEISEQDKNMYSLYVPYTTLNEFCDLKMNKYFSEVDIAYHTGMISENKAFMYIFNKFKYETYEGKKYCSVTVSNSDSSEESRQAVKLITIVFVLVSGIVFLVSGLGLINTLLVSISERTQEIGILKAIGARDRDIGIQFITEACIICMSGCFIGIAVYGLIIILLRNNIEDLLALILDEQFSFIISNSGVNPGVGFPYFIAVILISFLMGISFSWYPARKAMNMQPVDSLRFE